VASEELTFRARVRTQVGRLRLELELSAAAGSTTVLVGPNGAGKTTFLRILAGLARAEEAHIELGTQILEDTKSGIRIPAEKRPIALVFQDGRLFPHMTALENVAFGPIARGVPARAAREEAARLLGRLGAAPLASARPGALSGGEIQRVALARALAGSPRMLVLDEPFSAIDASARGELRRLLLEHLALFEGPRLVVTHDPVEAAALADRIAVLEEGRLVQSGTVAEVCARPRSTYVAHLVGLNLYRGVASAGRITTSSGSSLIAAEGQGDVFAVLHPRAVALHRERPSGTPRNVWRGEIESLEPLGDRLRVRVGGALPIVAEITRGAADELALQQRGAVWISFKATEVEVFPAS